MILTQSNDCFFSQLKFPVSPVADIWNWYILTVEYKILLTFKITGDDIYNLLKVCMSSAIFRYFYFTTIFIISSATFWRQTLFFLHHYA